MNCSEVTTTAEALRLVVPNDENWNVRNEIWYASFDAMLVLLCVLNTGLVACALLSLYQRRALARFPKVRRSTFIAIDIALAILGVSRVTFLSLDPWGQNEYFVCQGCAIVSRFLSTLAFPSLTASYTLLFITLWTSARMRLGSLMIQKLRILLPLCFSHYGIAIIVEVIASLPMPPNAAIGIIITCEAIFALWGIILCTSFMIAGVRLIRTINLSAHSSSLVCRDTPERTRHDLMKGQESPAVRYQQRTKSMARNLAQEKHQRAVKKISRITYLAASLAILYSCIILTNLVLICLNLFDGCPGKIGEKAPSTERWLSIIFLQLVIEFFLAALLSYANTDYRPFLCSIKKTLYCTTQTEAAQVTELSLQKTNTITK